MKSAFQYGSRALSSSGEAFCWFLNRFQLVWRRILVWWYQWQSTMALSNHSLCSSAGGLFTCHWEQRSWLAGWGSRGSSRGIFRRLFTFILMNITTKNRVSQWFECEIGCSANPELSLSMRKLLKCGKLGIPAASPSLPFENAEQLS